ncbi:hypothetical protein GN956_G3406 [Arapaima gigas]
MKKNAAGSRFVLSRWRKETSAGMAAAMSDSHRRFLQIIMCHGIMEGSQARAVHQHCCQAYGTQHTRSLDEFVDTINSQLQPLFMQIRKGMSEDEGLQYYALVNVADTDVTKMSSDYAANELELFRKTMDLIVDSENGTASSTDILNCADSLQTSKMKKKETEQVLSRLVQDKWLNEKHGEYTLSTRSIMEMEQYIRNTYQDLVKSCAICHNIAFQSQMCSNQSCGVKIHIPCAARYYKGRADPRCPKCSEFWSHEIPDMQTSSQATALNPRASTKDNAAPAASGSQSRRSR